MIKNTGQLDRIIRIVLGVALVAWALLGTDAWHLLGWLGLILIGTAAVGWCPIYRVLGLSTEPKASRR